MSQWAGQQAMPNTWRMPAGDHPICPGCQRDMSFVASWTFRGLWGHNEVRTFECPDHGPVFISPPAAARHGREKPADKSVDGGDRDALVPAPRKPAPTLNVDAIALPEPD
jgi:hypothetical protein